MHKQNGFRRFILLEQEEFLAQKVGDVLSSIQSLSDDSVNMGNRQLLKISEKIVAEMRKILDSHWSKEEEPFLKVIQKVAVAMAKAVDSNEKMADVLTGAKAELERLQMKLGAPINNVGAIDEPKGTEAE